MTSKLENFPELQKIMDDLKRQNPWYKLVLHRFKVRLSCVKHDGWYRAFFYNRYFGRRKKCWLDRFFK